MEKHIVLAILQTTLHGHVTKVALCHLDINLLHQPVANHSFWPRADTEQHLRITSNPLSLPLQPLLWWTVPRRLSSFPQVPPDSSFPWDSFPPMCLLLPAPHFSGAMALGFSEDQLGTHACTAWRCAEMNAYKAMSDAGAGNWRINAFPFFAWQHSKIHFRRIPRRSCGLNISHP